MVITSKILLKYFEFPLSSFFKVDTLNPIRMDVTSPIIIHQRIPWKPPSPKIPAVIPINILLTIFMNSIDWLLFYTDGVNVKSKYFSFNSFYLLIYFFWFSNISVWPAGTVLSARKSSICFSAEVCFFWDAYYLFAFILI